MNDETRKNLFDILQAAEEIETFTHGIDYQAYKDSPIIQRAAERDFEIIGEALNRIKKSMRISLKQCQNIIALLVLEIF